MKTRIKITNWRISCEEGFFYIIEIKKHWWSRWKYLEDLSSDNHMPLLFRDREAIGWYLKRICGL